MRLNNKYILAVLAFVMILFVSIGYKKSDKLYYKKLLKENNLSKPYDIFIFLSRDHKHDSCVIVHTNATPRHLITNHKRLWCDEGSTVLATLCYYAGYETRLVRMINSANIDNHTFLQVKEGNIWRNYDFSFQAIDAPIDSVASIAHVKLRDLRHYDYPRLYNKIINANFFVKKLALYSRRIDESDFVK